MPGRENGAPFPGSESCAKSGICSRWRLHSQAGVKGHGHVEGREVCASHTLAPLYSHGDPNRCSRVPLFGCGRVKWENNWGRRGGEGRGRNCLPATLPPQLFPCQGLPEWLGSDQASAKERTHFIAQQAAFPHRWTSHIKSLGALTCKDNPPPLCSS